MEPDETPKTTEAAKGLVSLRAEVRSLADRVDQTYMELGRRLRVVCDSDAAETWGFKNFDDYVEQELGFKRRKARYLMMIADKAEEFGLSYADLAGLGWSKAKEILSRVESRADFDSWSQRVLRDDLSVAALVASLKLELEGTVSTPGGDRDADGNKLVVTADGEKIHIVEVPLFDAQYENVKLALVRAGEIAGSEKVGHLLDMICLDWLANNSSVAGLGEKLADWVNRNLIELDGAE